MMFLFQIIVCNCHIYNHQRCRTNETLAARETSNPSNKEKNTNTENLLIILKILIII